MQNHKQRIGQWGESVAAHYLESRGYRILGRNLRAARGEIDVIAAWETGRADPLIVFVEVKTRTNARFGLPEEAVDDRKLEHVFRAAEAYIQEHPELGTAEWRIDMISIQGKPGARVEDVDIQHFENISG